MKPHISLITLGVDDLDRAVTFYRDGLGLPTEGIVGQELEHGAVAFFELPGGLKLALWARRDMAHDTGVDQPAGTSAGIVLAHNVSSRNEVGAVLEEARSAGATIVKPAQDTFWGGYAGYFADPDGHLWEVAWNPAFDSETPDSDGTQQQGRLR